MEKKSRNGKKSRGFTLLLAALIASVALALGASIYSIVAKELVLSSTGQDSQYAFYAADTAAECALYWNSRYPNTFATSSASAGTATSIECDDQTVPVTIVASSPTAATSTVGPTQTSTTTVLGYDLFTDSSAGFCANATVASDFDEETDSVETYIVANGYSVACSQVGTAQTSLQRSVELVQ